MYLVIDFEATCWDRQNIEGWQKTENDENEIIEIGAAIVNNDFKIISNIGCFVKPVKNPILSDFCKKLTKIRQDDVDDAKIFPEALSKFRNQVKIVTDKELDEFVFCSWGHYDKYQLIDDCKYHNVDFPFKYHVSLKHDFADRHKVKAMGVKKALDFFGLDFEGTHHRGIDDAKNIARIFIKEWSIKGFQLREDHRVIDSKIEDKKT